MGRASKSRAERAHRVASAHGVRRLHAAWHGTGVLSAVESRWRFMTAAAPRHSAGEGKIARYLLKQLDTMTYVSKTLLVRRSRSSASRRQASRLWFTGVTTCQALHREMQGLVWEEVQVLVLGLSGPHNDRHRHTHQQSSQHYTLFGYMWVPWVCEEVF